MDKNTSRQALRLAGENKNIFAAVGIHPHNARRLDKKQLLWFEEKINHPRVVGLGEIGLDYYYDNSSRNLQKQMLAQFLRLARITSVPVIIHLRPEKNSSPTSRCRPVFRDLFELLDLEGGHKLCGLFHCFAGNQKELHLAGKYRFFYSAAGNITFPRSENLRKTFMKIRRDRLLIETDSPYMSPTTFRGKQNHPFRVKNVLEKLSELYSVPEEILADKINNNTRRLFGEKLIPCD